MIFVAKYFFLNWTRTWLGGVTVQLAVNTASFKLQARALNKLATRDPIPHVDLCTFRTKPVTVN